MKRNLRTHLSLAILLSCLSSSAFAAGDGAGVRGGGQVIDVNGTIEMLDELKQSTCDWRSGTEVIEQNPYVGTLLAKIADLDWYFSMELKREMSFLTFCYTGSLYKVNVQDKNAPMTPPKGKTIQAALRDNADVFVDEGMFNKMDPRRRAYLLMHETLHSYLDMGDPLRNLHLRSMNQAIIQIDTGALVTREKLHRDMYQNGIEFPLTVDRLDSYREKIEFALGTTASQVDAILNSDDPESLADLDLGVVKPLLAPWDANALSMQTTQELFIQVLIQGMKSGTPTQFQALLKKKYEATSPILVALGIYDQLSKQKQKIVDDAASETGDLFSQVYAQLDKAKVSYGDFRIQASPELQALTSTPSGVDAPLTGLTPLNPDQYGTADRTPVLAEAIVHSIAQFIHRGNWQAVESNMTENARFYEVLGLQKQKQAIAAMDVKISREKPLALSVITQIRDGLVASMLQDWQAQLSQADFARLKQMIHFDRF